MALASDASVEALPDHDPRSIGIEVFVRLFPVRYGDVVAADAAACLAFLDTPTGEELAAWGRWTRYWASIDWFDRHEALCAKPYAKDVRRPLRYASRSAVERLLRRWQTEKLRTEEVRERAFEIADRYGIAWCPLDDPACVRVEVVRTLSSLDWNLVTVADVPALLECVRAAPGQERSALRRLIAYRDDVDLDARIAALESDPAYTTFHQRRHLERRRYGAPSSSVGGANPGDDDSPRL